MKIGLIKEIKPQEHRTALLPSGVAQLTARGHVVFVEKEAGKGAGFRNEDYQSAGAIVMDGARDVCQAAELLVKVKQPGPSEFPLLRKGQTIFSYLHSETRPHLIRVFLEKEITSIAFENVVLENGYRPLLAPMSIIAGQQAILQGSQFLCKHRGGAGVSLVSYPGLPRIRVVVLGGGHAGEHAARTAAALGASVALFEIDEQRIRELVSGLPNHVEVLNPENVPLEPWLVRAQMIINTTSIPAHSRTHLVKRSLLRKMKPGTVIVDVTANIEGAVESIDRYTTHDEPIWEVDGIIHYAVPNIPGTVAQTASMALSGAVLPYLLELADHGIVGALKRNPALAAGLTTHTGRLTWREAARRLGMKWTPAVEAMGESAWEKPTMGDHRTPRGSCPE